MIIPYYPWSGDEKTGASGDPRRSCGNTASSSTRAARLRPPPSKKMSENLTRWEVWRMQRLRRNIRRVETGMIFAVWAFEKLFTRLSCEESFTRLSLRLPEASVTGTTREQCFHIDFKRSFLRILGGGEKLTMKGKNCQNCTNTHPHTHTYNESVVFF